MTNQNPLRRLDDNLAAVPGFENLPKEKQDEILAEQVSGLSELRVRVAEKVAQSRVAEHDLNMTIETINQLDQERRVYKVSKDLKTGSGHLSLIVRGGDLWFVLPVLVVLGMLVLLLILLLAH